MISCPDCGYQNNDGSCYCLNCRKQIPKSQKKSEFEITMEAYDKEKDREKQRNYIIRRNALICLVIIVVVGIFVFSRMGSAKERAETLVSDYLLERYSDISRVECSSMPNYWGDEFRGFSIAAAAYLKNGEKVYFSANVFMNTYLDEGKISSIQLYGKEIYN